MEKGKKKSACRYVGTFCCGKKEELELGAWHFDEQLLPLLILLWSFLGASTSRLEIGGQRLFMIYYHSVQF